MRLKFSSPIAVTSEMLEKILKAAAKPAHEKNGEEAEGGEENNTAIENAGSLLRLPPSDNRLVIKISKARGEPGDDIGDVFGLPPIGRPRPPFRLIESEVERVLSGNLAGTKDGLRPVARQIKHIK